MKKIGLFFFLPVFLFAKEPEYRQYEREIYTLIRHWYSWKEQIRQKGEKELEKLLGEHSPKIQESHKPLWNHFTRSLSKLEKAARLLVELDTVIGATLQAFRGVSHSREGKLFQYQAKLHRLGEKLLEGTNEFWNYATRRYFYLKQGKKKKKKTSLSPMRLPRYAPRISLVSALTYRLQKMDDELLEFAKEWRKALKSFSKKASYRDFFLKHRCEQKENCPLRLTSLSARMANLIFRRSFELEKRLEKLLEKNPKAGPRLPGELFLLGKERARLLERIQELLDLQEKTYHKFVKKN